MSWGLGPNKRDFDLAKRTMLAFAEDRIQRPSAKHRPESSRQPRRCTAGMLWCPNEQPEARSSSTRLGQGCFKRHNGRGISDTGDIEIVEADIRGYPRRPQKIVPQRLRSNALLFASLSMCCISQALGSQNNAKFRM